MTSLIGRNLIAICIIGTSLSACSPAGSNNNTANTPAASGPSEADRAAAQQKLQRMLDEKRQRQAYEAEQQKIAEERAAQAAAEAAKPHYDPHRTVVAAQWRQWADITIPDYNIHAWLKTNWRDGRMHFRLALLGDKTALRIFTGEWPYFRLTFADQGGVNLHQVILQTRDLHWDDGLRNSGVPTMDFESDDDIPLEIYERIIQWNLKWEDHID